MKEILDQCKPKFAAATLLGLAMLLVGCFPKSEGHTHNDPQHDPKLAPYFDAMRQVDRAALGFTPIATNATIVVEGGAGREYDTMLHVYQDTSRTITFRKTSNGFRWTGEQEVFQGPRWNRTVDGNSRESIVIRSESESVNGAPTNQLSIWYTGPDSDLERRQLSPPEARKMLDQWKTTAVEPEPPPLPYASFDPLPFLVFVCMLMAALGMVVLSLIIGVIGFAIASLLIFLGIISTSTITGLLLKSASAGFKAFTLQAGAVLGLGAGIASCYLVAVFRHTGSPSTGTWVLAAASGVVTGLVLALALNWVCAATNRRLRGGRKINTAVPPVLTR